METLLSLAGVFIGSVLTLLSAKQTAETGRITAQIQADKELLLQTNKLRIDAILADARQNRIQSCVAYKLMGKLVLGYGQTGTLMEWDKPKNLAEFRSRYITDNTELCDIEAWAAVYFPDLVDEIQNIQCILNIIWGTLNNYY